jgi:23S rRNA (adenine2503-C2)-methyltransferase
VNVYDLSLPQLQERLAAWSEPAYRARQVYAGLWHRAAGYEDMTDVPAGLRERLAEELPAHMEVLTEREADGGATRKALLRFGGRHIVETVLMGYPDRATVCVSSQAGCAMGCGFCATGQMGLKGNLTAGEIAAQVVWAVRAARSLPDSTPRRVTNVVFMGMGEPMSNYRATSDAVSRLTDPAGMNLGARHVTVSTVGVVPGIIRLATEHPRTGLAVSFHAADDELRNELVPVNQMWPLAKLEAAIDTWRQRTRRRPSIEWAMIREVNDSDHQAELLSGIARRLHAHVNLIPLNPTPGSPTQPSTPRRMRAFVDILRSRGANVTVRDTRGREIDAACGQLRWAFDARLASGESGQERQEGGVHLPGPLLLHPVPGPGQDDRAP